MFQFYKDKEIKDLFKQKQTYKVLLSLLYENKRYAELYELYREIRKHLELYETYPDQTMNCLAVAACYHLVNVNLPLKIIIWAKKTKTNFILFQFSEYARAFSICTRFVPSDKASEPIGSYKIFAGWVGIKAGWTDDGIEFIAWR